MRFSRLACCSLLILSILALIRPAFAYARITEVYLWAPIQGNIHQEIPIQGDIYTGYNVVEYVTNVTATLMLPPNVTVTSGENPLFIGDMGPGPAYARCLWALEFEDSGEYVLMLNATCIDTQKLPRWMNASATIRIYAPPHVEFEYTPDTDVYANDTITFNASKCYARGPESSIVWYNWDFGDGDAVTTNETLIEHKFVAAGNYSVSLNVTDNHELSNIYTANVSVNEKTLLGDLNSDGKVNITDISIVAIAFGSYDGEPRWNEKCDLNYDKTINILDLTIVATQYGKEA